MLKYKIQINEIELETLVNGIEVRNVLQYNLKNETWIVILLCFLSLIEMTMEFYIYTLYGRS